MIKTLSSSVSKFISKILNENLPGTWGKPMVPEPNNVLLETHKLAIEDSAKYIMQNMQSSISFHSDLELLSYAFNHRQILNGLVLEFGVYKGTSITHLATLTEQQIFGFDSFNGLKEDWGGNWITKGHFNLDGVPPEVPKNVSLIPGWFQDTLLQFLQTVEEKKISFMHIDSDTYETCRYILETLKDKIQIGTVIVFNEYHGYRGWREGEFKAFQEFCLSQKVKYTYIGFSREAVGLIVNAKNN